MTPGEYNRRALDRGELTDEHLVELVRAYQGAHGLDPDGMAGPRTRAVLDRASRKGDLGELRVIDGWLRGDGVQRVPADPSWYGGPMPDGPLAIMAHYTATDPGTAETMARKRVPARHRDDRAASWHLTIAQDGRIWQMVPLTQAAWHCRRGYALGPTRKHRRINDCAIGVELEGHGDHFPAAQITAAMALWPALVRAYGIPRRHAMLEHSQYDPGRRRDPGPVWMRECAPVVLAGCYE